jgi:hypothetical protein
MLNINIRGGGAPRYTALAPQNDTALAPQHLFKKYAKVKTRFMLMNVGAGSGT